MKFRFRLESLLRVRRIREDQQQSALALANAEVKGIAKQLAELEQSLTSTRQQHSKLLSSGLSGAELQFDADCLRQAIALRQQLQVELQKARMRAQHARDTYLASRRDRRAVETLRDRLKQEFEHTQERKEQAALDEMYLLRRPAPEHKLPSD